MMGWRTVLQLNFVRASQLAGGLRYGRKSVRYPLSVRPGI